MSEVMSVINLVSTDSVKPVAKTSNTEKSEEFASVYNESVNVSENSSNKELATEKTKTTDVKQIVDKESKIGSNDLTVVEDGNVDLEEKLMLFLEDVKQKALDMNVDVLSLLQMLFNYTGTNDISIMTDFLINATNAQSPAELVLNPNMMELMSSLKQLSSQLDSLLQAMNIEKSSLTSSDISLISSSFEEFIQSGFNAESIDLEDLSNKLSNKQVVDNNTIVKSEDEVIAIDVHNENNVTTDDNSDLTKDNSVIPVKSENSEDDNVSNLFINKFNTIEVVKDKIENVNQANQTKTLENLLKQDVVQQIVNRIQISTVNNSSSMTIQLKPEHLGNLLFTITSNKGSVTAQFVAENASVKEAIEMNLFQLKTTLEQQGINVDDIEVSLANNQYFEQRRDQGNQFDDKNNRRRVSNVNSVDGDEELLEEENMTPDIDNTRVIDYSA